MVDKPLIDSRFEILTEMAYRLGAASRGSPVQIQVLELMMRQHAAAIVANKTCASHTDALTEMAYLIELVPWGTKVPDRILGEIQQQYIAAIAAENGCIGSNRFTDEQLRSLWHAAGGRFHGPNIETGTMPEASLLPFLRQLAGSAAAQGDPISRGGISVEQARERFEATERERNGHQTRLERDAHGYRDQYTANRWMGFSAALRVDAAW